MCQKRLHNSIMKFGIIIILLSIVPVTDTSAYSKKCSQIKVGVVDTGLNTKDPRFKGHICPTGHSFVNKGEPIDTNGHGTFIASLIQEYAKNANYCMEIFKYYESSDPGSINLAREVEALRSAVKDGVNVVNFSGGGEGFNEEESLIIKYSPETTFVVAAGNDGRDLDLPYNEYYPASYFYPNMEVVGAIDINGKRVPSSNYGKKVENKELGEHVRGFLPNGLSGYMTGTSMSVAIFTGKLVNKMYNECMGTK